MHLRRLAAIRAQQNGGYKAKGAISIEFDTKIELTHACREMGESLCIPMAFKLSNASEERATPYVGRASVEEEDDGDNESAVAEPPADTKTQVESVRIVAKYVRNDKVWRIVGSDIQGDRGHAFGAHSRPSAYRIIHLARHVERLLATSQMLRGWRSGIVCVDISFTRML